MNQIDFNSLINVNFLLKAFEALFLVIFLIYAVLTIREVYLMNNSLSTKIGFGIKVLAFVQLALALLVFTIVILF